MSLLRSNFGRQVGEQQISRRIGLMHLLVRSAAIGVNHGHQPLVRFDDLLAIGTCSHTQQLSRTIKRLVARRFAPEIFPRPASENQLARKTRYRRENDQAQHWFRRVPAWAVAA